MNVLTTTVEKLSRVDALIEEVLHDEQNNSSLSLGGANKNSDESILRYIIFQMTFGEAIQPLHAALHMAKMTDEEVREMCESENMTVKEALHNAKANMVMDMLKNLMN